MDDGKKSVFISHSSRDEQAVMLVCQALERNGLGCWVSSRDIPPKADWAVSITRGLEETGLVVLVLSENAVESNEVLKELTLASQMKMPIVTFRIDKVKPPRGFMFHLAIEQWVPGSNPPTDRQLQTLVGVVDQCLLGLRRDGGIFGSRGPFSRDRRKGTLARLVPAVAVLAALVAFGVPYLQGRFGGGTQDGAPRQTRSDAGGAEADSLARALSDTVGVPADVAVITGQTPPPPTWGTVTLTTHPAGASAYIDGGFVGNTPLQDHELASGSHTARFRLAGYRTETRTVEVQAGACSSYDLPLSRELTTLDVTSIPDGAEVVLDGSRLGTTPCTFDRLESGEHVVVTAKDGYATRRDTVRLSADRPDPLEVRLERRVGQLTVTVLPSGSFSINGDPKSEDTNVPKTERLSPGTYEVEARHVIYGTWRKTVQIADGDDKSLVFDFSREYDITVTSDPPNAAIFVNGRFWGSYTPHKISLRPGQRRIDVQLDGYHSPGAREITVEEGVAAFVDFDLMRAP